MIEGTVVMNFTLKAGFIGKAKKIACLRHDDFPYSMQFKVYNSL